MPFDGNKCDNEVTGCSLIGTSEAMGYRLPFDGNKCDNEVTGCPLIGTSEAMG